MTRIIRQSTSIDVPIGPFLDDTDGKTAETALTLTQPDVRVKKNGGAWAQKAAAQTLSHEEAGWYELTLDATDTDTVGLLTVAVAESGALPVWEHFQVVEEAIYDALFAASATGALPVSSGGITTASFAAGAIDAAAIAANAIGASELAADAVTEIQSGLATAAALTTAQADLDDLQTRLPAALVSGRMDSNVGAMANDVMTAAAAAADLTTELQSGLSTLTAAQVNAEMVDALNVDTYAEPGQENPPSTTTLAKKIGYVYKMMRNRKTQTATAFNLYADDATTVDQKATVADDGTTASITELATGP